jgi:hypothetical protein
MSFSISPSVRVHAAFVSAGLPRILELERDTGRVADDQVHGAPIERRVPPFGLQTSRGHATVDQSPHRGEADDVLGQETVQATLTKSGQLGRYGSPHLRPLDLALVPHGVDRRGCGCTDRGLPTSEELHRPTAMVPPVVVASDVPSGSAGPPRLQDPRPYPRRARLRGPAACRVSTMRSSTEGCARHHSFSLSEMP